MFGVSCVVFMLRSEALFRNKKLRYKSLQKNVIVMERLFFANHVNKPNTKHKIPKTKYTYFSENKY